MYLYKQRKKAVELYIKYGKNADAVIRKLGYPDRHSLKDWYKEYCEKGHLHRKYADGRTLATSPYTEEQMKAAVSHYMRNGKSISVTIKALGYPKGRQTPSCWIERYRPGEKRVCKTGHAPIIKYCQEVKEASILDFCAGNSSAEAVARRHGVDRCSLCI